MERIKSFYYVFCRSSQSALGVFFSVRSRMIGSSRIAEDSLGAEQTILQYQPFCAGISKKKCEEVGLILVQKHVIILVQNQRTRVI